jgi:hypothetical protein
MLGRFSFITQSLLVLGKRIYGLTALQFNSITVFRKNKEKMKKKLSCEKNRSTTKDAGSASPALREQKNRINYKYQSGDPPADAGC